MKENKRPAKTKHSAVRSVVLFFCLVMFLTSAGYLGWKYYEGYRNEQQYGNINRPEESSSSVVPGLSRVVQPKFEELLQQNPDTVGWLAIEGTSVDYPVVQRAGDDEHYLKYDFLGNKNPYGALYVDSRAVLDSSKNTVIYGHNLNNAQMFGALMNYKQLDYYQKHPTIGFDTLYGDGEYKIIGMFIVDASEESRFNYHDFINAYSPEQTREFLQKVANRTLIQTGVDVNENDTLLTLSTCSYEFSDARFAVVARKVRPGESVAVDTSIAVKNPQPLMPDVWYEIYGGTKPNLP